MSEALAAKIDALDRLLAEVAATCAPAALASSLSIEDQVLADAILRAELPIEIFTLDTGRLHGDTLALVEAIARRYGYNVRIVRPDLAAVADYVANHGRDAFYSNASLRQRCCEIRKVEPLRRALAGKRAWLTGLRRTQSIARGDVPLRARDPVHGIDKINPLVDWTEDDVWAYIRTFAVPYNTLYDQGYRSIGCAPCSRPVTPAEDVRAGRWWWEEPAARECGLHVGPDGRLVRAETRA